MSTRTEHIPLIAASPGQPRQVRVHRYGTPGARPKAYLHAGLHADEIPGMLVLHHLRERLDRAAVQGEILGEILVLPVANPIGIGQNLNAEHLGRFELSGGGNFNRGFPDLDEWIDDGIADRLGPDPAANTEIVRQALAAAVESLPADSELEDLRRTLMRLAVDADFVLDLHCDLEAVMHVFTAPELWPDAADLCAQIGAEAVMLQRASGGNPFDEAFSAPWSRLTERFGPAKPIPNACLSATIELRGIADVDDRLAAVDAANLYRFLQRRGLVAGDPGPLPAPKCDATPLTGSDSITAPAAGIVSFTKQPGETVAAGEVVAELIDPTADDPNAARLPLKSRAGGILYGRQLAKLVRPGQTVCKVAGPEPLAHRTGKLSED